MRLATRDPKRIRKNNVVVPLHQAQAEMLERALSPYLGSDSEFTHKLIKVLKARRGQYEMKLPLPLGGELFSNYKAAIYELERDAALTRSKVKDRPTPVTGRFTRLGPEADRLKTTLRFWLRSFTRPKLTQGFKYVSVENGDAVLVNRIKQGLKVHTTVGHTYQLTREIHNGYSMAQINATMSRTDMIAVAMDQPAVIEDQNLGTIIEFFGGFYKEDGKLGDKDVHFMWANVIGPFDGLYLFGLGPTQEGAKEEAKRHLANMMIKKEKEKRSD